MTTDEREIIEVEEIPFAQVSEEVGYDHRISPQAFRTYFCLLRHGTTPDRCFPSHKRIAELTGLKVRSVPRYLMELYETGWVARRINPPDPETKQRRSNSYYVAQRRTTADKLAVQFVKGREPEGLRRGREAAIAQECAEDPSRRSARLTTAIERHQENDKENPHLAMRMRLSSR